tara:strand:- start:9054 stop:11939 length:2886 start_codon:yes stop_codon:yes gene_type:complete
MSVDYVKSNPDIVQESKDLVLTQFGDSDNIQKFVEIIAEEAKSYEEVAEKIFTSFLLINATGFALDSIGEFLNFPREGRSDDAYRTALVISAIGSNSKITRDSIYRLVEIVTGGLGGYFYNGRYHDLYIYLQDACVERAIAAEFLDKYLPTNTQASVLFESGEAFGFEGNDAAVGFDKVRQTSSEGVAFVQFPVQEAVNIPEMVIPNNFKFLGQDGYTYRTVDSVDLKTSIVATEWDIPNTYIAGDILGASILNNTTKESFAAGYQVQNTATADFETMQFVIDTLLQANVVTDVNIYADDSSGYKVYAGYEEITDPSSFSGRNSSATEFLVGNIMRTVGVDVLRDKRNPDTGDIVGILYETEATNLVPYGNDISTGTGFWNLTGTIDISDVEQAIHFLYDARNYEFSSDILFDGEITIPRDGYYTYSVFFRSLLDPSVDQVIGIDSDRAIFEDTNPTLSIVQDDFGTLRTEYYGLWVRAEVTTYLTAGTHTIYVGSEGSGEATYFGAMVERGRKSSSYIPTLGSVATRSQDFFNFTSEPDVVGFENSATVQVSAKDYDGFFAWSGVGLSNLSKGEIVVQQGMSFAAEESPGFTLTETISSSQWTTGFGPTGLTTYDESYSDAGGFCTRVSLTSRDILGFGTLAEPESFEYNLDSKLSEVVGVLDTSQDLLQPRLVGSYNKFTAQSWDNTYTGTTYGTVLRSPSGIDALAKFQTNLLTSIDSIAEPYESNSSDIALPKSPYYYEIDFENLPNSNAILLSKHWQISTADVVTRNTNTDGDEILEKLSTSAYLQVFVEYNSGSSQFDLKFTMQHSDVLKRVNTTTNVTLVEYTYSGQSDNTLLSYTDATLESPKNIGVLYDQFTGLYTVYVDGVEFDGVDGIPKFTSVDPSDDSGAVVGDLYKTSPYYDNRAFFRIEFQVDNTAAEPTTEDDYGTIEFIYNRSDLKYTSQLPLNTVDIFRRKIN